MSEGKRVALFFLYILYLEKEGERREKGGRDGGGGRWEKWQKKDVDMHTQQCYTFTEYAIILHGIHRMSCGKYSQLTYVILHITIGTCTGNAMKCVLSEVKWKYVTSPPFLKQATSEVLDVITPSISGLCEYCEQHCASYCVYMPLHITAMYTALFLCPDQQHHELDRLHSTMRSEKRSAWNTSGIGQEYRQTEPCQELSSLHKMSYGAGEYTYTKLEARTAHHQCKCKAVEGA